MPPPDADAVSSLLPNRVPITGTLFRFFFMLDGPSFRQAIHGKPEATSKRAILPPGLSLIVWPILCRGAGGRPRGAPRRPAAHPASGIPAPGPAAVPRPRTAAPAL